MPEIRLLYATAPDEETARRIARALVEDRLAACVNLFPQMRSVYRWEGSVESASETAMIVKTTASAADRARDRILNLHPYDEPAVIALEVDGVRSSIPFLEWIARETR